MNNRLTDKQRKHMEKIRALPCSLCDAPPVSEAHHIEQSLQFCVVALCESCHRGPVMGWHGQRRAWAVRKATELSALNVTIERLMA